MSSTKRRKKVSDLVGVSFGRLTVVEYKGLGRWDKHYWSCSCSCGGSITLPTYRITGKSPTLSCGCLRLDKLQENRFTGFKHGLAGTKLYGIYQSMLQRCYNPKSQRYAYYGAKGVIVCAEWRESVESFCTWAKENGYSEGLSIDRVDTSGNYEPSNCRWITVSENSSKMNRERYGN